MKDSETIKNFLEKKNDELLTSNDAAKLINKSPQMVTYLAKHNKLNYLETRSGVRLFLKSEVEELIAA